MSKMKKPAPKPCDCIAQVNEQLALMNAKITQSVLFDFSAKQASMSAPLIELHKIDSSKKKSLPTLHAAHCPFCGKKF